ncbi:Protein of uncharacterised function (DUF2971) [Legionella steigerwaltii]|uniref:Protein of uncharacterized function (DUF2971) n=1 Tax=Legionella steigerwaltii TaxID=460 RepID=A0A378LJ40_9GAMM|nr:DUF2971 domain-containing protein [Legionella steigerwaltii]KTD78540.1 hypothetical protein Lstg_1275 [Legionella steigerwaltii]STY24101.1 Protein of uncharacterised function (DUF2971) [Legionella steigerwaltii]
MEAEELVSQYKEKCFKSYENFEPQSHREMFHFTSFDNLKKILSSKSLLHTKSNELNDSLEIKYSLQYLSDILDKVGFDSSNDFLKQMIERYFEGIEIYVTCFSKKVDDLNLWRLYGDNGLGVSLGFSQNLPFQNETNMKIPNIPILTHVIYGEEVFKKKISKLAKRALTIINSQPFKSSSHQEEFKLELVKSLSLAVIMNTLNTKHKHFSIEEEIRSILLQGKYAWCSYNSNGWYFDESEFITIALRSITLGPAHNKVRSTINLEALLASNGFDSNNIEIKQF